MGTMIMDLGALSVALLMVAAYQTYMHWRLRHQPEYTVHAVTRAARAKWVEQVMNTTGMEVLAVQTLRNSVMAASFMASTSILLMIGVLSLSAGSADRHAAIWQALNMGAIHAELVTFKLVLLLVDFFIAFFGFSMAVRFYNHVGYMINVPPSEGMETGAPARVAYYLNRAARYYAFGTRAFFFCVPLVFWLFGPNFLVAATAGLIVFLYRLDRAPRS